MNGENGGYYYIAMQKRLWCDDAWRYRTGVFN